MSRVSFVREEPSPSDCPPVRPASHVVVVAAQGLTRVAHFQPALPLAALGSLANGLFPRKSPMMRPTARWSTAGFLSWAVTVALGVGSAFAPSLPASAASAPTVTAVSPSAGPLVGGNTVTLTGTTFTGASKVLFGTLPATRFTVASATKITAVVPAATAGTVNVRVTTPSGTSAGAPQNRYTYQAVPTVTAVSPTEGPLAGANTVTLTGTSFTGASKVLFGSRPATRLTVVSATKITAVAPGGAPGTVSVRVTTPGGTSLGTSQNRYKYVGAISAGRFHTCALATLGAVKCWGDNEFGELGNGTTVNSSTPVQVSGLTSGVKAISAGSESDTPGHTCALTTGGAVKCWGGNWDGQLGNGTTTGSSTPVQVSGLTSGVVAITSGLFHTCALTSGGAAKCWGFNGTGQLGTGTTSGSKTPVQVTGLTTGVTAITAGVMHTCAIAAGGAAKCWGFNSGGQLGNGTTTTSPTPLQVTGLATGVTAINADTWNTCAVASGAAKCWGYNAGGQLGNGTTADSATPVQVSGLTTGVAAISAGLFHACALTVAGVAKCWGANADGQLGNGTTTDSLTPVSVTGL